MTDASAAARAAKERQFKATCQQMNAPQLKDLFDQLKAEGDDVPLRLLLFVSGEYGRALKDPLRRF
jgi:hypothetical protein